MKILQPFRQLHATPWQGALGVQAYQRLTLRLYLAMLLLFLAGSLVVGASLLAVAGITALSPASIGWATRLPVATIFILMALAIGWFMWGAIKLEVLRLRNLGFRTRGAVAIQVLLLAAMAVQVVVPLSTAYTGPTPWAQYVLLLAIPMALYSYLTFFEATPLAGGQTPLLPTMQAPNRLETYALFALQTYMWYTILRTPLDIIFT